MEKYSLLSDIEKKRLSEHMHIDQDNENNDNNGNDNGDSPIKNKKPSKLERINDIDDFIYKGNKK